MTKPTYYAAGFVIYRITSKKIIEYLLMQASYGNFHWTPPKGHVENSETEIDTAIRETKEESGIQANALCIHHDFKKLLKYDLKEKDGLKCVTYWLARLNDPNTPIVLSDEHKSYEWLPLVQAKEKAAFPDLQQLLDECEHYLSEHMDN